MGLLISLTSSGTGTGGNRTFVVNSEAEMLALPATVGDIAIRLDISETFILAELPATDIANWPILTIGGVISFNGRDGIVIPQLGDYTTSIVAEGTSLYFTSPRVRTTDLTGLTITNATVTAGDSVLSAFGKLQGQINAGVGDKVTSVFGRIGDVVAENGDYSTTLVTEGTNLYFTNSRALTAVEKTNNATGFSVAGGTASKTLTVSEDSTINQNLSTTSDVEFQGTTIKSTLPTLSLNDSADPNKTLDFKLNHTTKQALISAYNLGVEPYDLILNPSLEGVGVGYPVGTPIPDIVPNVKPCLATFCPSTGFHLFESNVSTALSLTTIYKTGRYSEILPGDLTNKGWEIGLKQTLTPANDLFSIGRTNFGDFFGVFRDGNIGVNTSVAPEQKFLVNGDIGTTDNMLFGEISTPATPTSGFKIFSNSADAGGPYVVLKNGNVKNLLDGTQLTPAEVLAIVEKVNNPSGFTLSGGTTTTKSLDILENCTIDQNLTTTSFPNFNGTTYNTTSEPALPTDAMHIYAVQGTGKEFLYAKNRAGDVIDVINSGKVTSVSANYEITQSDKLVKVDSSVGPVVISWDQNKLKDCTVFVKKVAGGNTVTLDPNSGLISGKNSVVISQLGEVIEFICDGTDSYIVNAQSTELSDYLILPKLASAPNFTEPTGNAIFTGDNNAISVRGTYDRGGFPSNLVFTLDNCAGRNILYVADGNPANDVDLTRQDHFVEVDTTTNVGNVRWDPVATEGKRFSVKLIAGANNVVLTPDSGLIDGQANYTFNTLNRCITFISNGTNTSIVAQYN